jgi:hypothetical protein
MESTSAVVLAAYFTFFKEQMNTSQIFQKD